MATYDDLIALVTAETTTVDSVLVLIDTLKTQVADVLSGASIPPAVQAKVDAIFGAASANKGKLDAALAANVTPVTESTGRRSR